MFKVGDWVRVSNERVKIGKIIEADEFYYTIENYGQVDLSDVELWLPREGEWCWVGKNLSKIVAHDRDGYFTCLTSSGTYTAFMKLEYIYKIAEPFIGELPSFLQH